MPALPTLTNEQRHTAFTRSLELRRERAALKADLAVRAHGIDLEMAFYLPIAQGMKVIDLLTALPLVGPVKAKRLLAKAGIPEKNTVRACGPRQRERLLELL